MEMDKQLKDFLDDLDVQNMKSVEREYERVTRNLEIKQKLESVKQSVKQFGQDTSEKAKNVLAPVQHRLDYEATKREVGKLETEIGRQIALAKINGLSVREGDSIDALKEKHAEKVEKLIAVSQRIEADKHDLLSRLNNVKEAIVTKIEETYNSIHDSIDHAIGTSVSTMNLFKDTLVKANEQAKEVGIEAYTGLTERIESINRASLLRDAKDYDSMAKHYDKLAELTQEKTLRHDRAVHNLKNAVLAFRGKEEIVMDETDAKRNAWEAGLDYKVIASSYREKAKQCRENVELSLSRSADTISTMKDVRKNLGMEENKSLDNLEQKIEKAKAEVQADKKAAMENKKEKTNTKNQPER